MNENRRGINPFSGLFGSPPLQLRPDRPVVIIGAANMDLSGTPDNPLRMRDSNPGRVRLSPGGVGRNIAENLARLGRRVYLMTVLGEDEWAGLIRQHCLNAGIDLRLTLTDPHARTSTYLCVNDRNGDLLAAVSDMAVYDSLTPDHLQPFLRELNEASMVIADANLPEETLVWLSKNLTVPMAADPVSAAKAPRLKNALSKLVLLKPNVAEAELLTGLSICGEADYRRAADALHVLGVQRVYLSLGAGGVYADDGKERALLPCVPGEIRNTTGCGDAFVAAAADAYLSGLGTLEAGRHALAAAAICASDSVAVSPRLCQETLAMML